MRIKLRRAVGVGFTLAIVTLFSSLIAVAETAPSPPAFSCGDNPPRPTAGGASVASAANESIQNKSWQPVGGVIEFTINSFEPIKATANVTTCFRWKLSDTTAGAAKSTEQRPTRVEMLNGGKTLKVTVEVKDPGAEEPRSLFDSRIARRIGIIPLAEVRIVALDGQTPVADVWTEIGITHAAGAIILAVLVVLLGFIALTIAVKYRVKHGGILEANWLLRIISTPSATASLSQLQILIWTFVVAASAVYVASLSGQLVEVTTGTLVLLGISGAATIAAKAHSENQAATQQVEAEKAKKEAEKAQESAVVSPNAATEANAEKTQKKADQTEAAAKAWKNPPADRKPQWSDLIVNESKNADGHEVREVDVARVQMLMFTLISASFVVVKVIAVYVIPDIPTGYLVLMGISNGVYVGSKVVRKT